MISILNKCKVKKRREMTEFVGAEYLIARMLVEERKQEISIAELDRLGICVRRRSIEEGVGVFF